MTTIHIEEELNLDKTHFKTLDEFQIYLMMQERDQEYCLSDAHKKIIDDRIKEADEAKEPGLSWEEVKANLQRKHD